MLLEEAVFNRQQELALNADRLDQSTVRREERALKEAENPHNPFCRQKLFPRMHHSLPREPVSDQNDSLGG